eukprot:2886726-Prymnesium_polylepis.1
MGRFCVWTESAFEKLDAVFGTATEASTEKVHNGVAYRMPKLQMANSDLSRLINSDEIQSKINAPKEGTKPAVLKSNPLKSTAAMEILNPFAVAQKKKNAEAQKKNEAKKSGKKIQKKVPKAIKAAKKAFYKTMVAKE